MPTVAELKKKGLKVGGNKAELLNRLESGLDSKKKDKKEKIGGKLASARKSAVSNSKLTLKIMKKSLRDFSKFSKLKSLSVGEPVWIDESLEKFW